MKVTYIYHSSFLAELDSVTMLFDYYKGNIPKIDSNKPFFVFASHAHGDHFSNKILELADQYPNIQYILSDDINENKIPVHCKNKVRFVKPNETIVLEKQSMTIETLRSNDEGVAFWICCEGKTIYHAGDLHYWFWREEDDERNRMIVRQYEAELEKLRGRHANVAFVVLDPRQKDDFFIGMNELMKVISADHIVPMHCWGDYSVIEKIKQLPCSASYRDRIAQIQKEGETFEWNN
ncbi:MAG: MBL fold metallo-hydrolase [Clostridiales bacterium]|nr:MBL fold metallo-hydrolase [Clostridiales bacterium]